MGQEAAYCTHMRMMSSDSTQPTMFVSKASPCGIAAIIYQVVQDGIWVPIGHISRALTKEKQAWASQIDWESLTKSWRMNQF